MNTNTEDKKLTIEEFTEKCIEYNQHHDTNTENFEICPVHIWASQNYASCKDVKPGIHTCKLCGEAMCPDCGNHNVTQVSRVTGYMSSVISWNNAKRQELKDRQHYTISGKEHFA